MPAAQAVFARVTGLHESTSLSPVKHGEALHVQYEPSDWQQCPWSGAVHDSTGFSVEGSPVRQVHEPSENSLHEICLQPQTPWPLPAPVEPGCRQQAMFAEPVASHVGISSAGALVITSHVQKSSASGIE